MKKRKMTLQELILILITFAMIGTYLGGIVSSVIVSKKHLEEGYLNENQFYAEKLAETTNSLFENMLQTLEVGAATINPLDPGNTNLYLELNQILQSTNFFNSVFLVDKNGIIIRSAPNLDLEGKKVETVGVKEAISKKKPIISQPYVSQVTGQLIILVSVPLFDNKGSYCGFIGGTIYLSENNSISDIIRLHPNHSSGSYVYVVDSKGNIISHPENKRMGDNVIENGAVQQVTMGRVGSRELTNTVGERMLAGYAFVKTSKWGIVSQTPKKSVVKPSFELVVSVGKATIPFILLVFIISILLLKRYVQPLRELANYAQRVAEKTSIKRPEIPERFYEVDELKKTMFLMVDHYRKQIKTFENEATLDPLTGLYNRRTLQKRIHEFEEYSIILFDIDHFKSVNDTYGHLMGDEVLMFLYQLIQTQIRPSDICFRYGGEEFLILLPDTNLETTYQIAERIRKTTEMTLSPVGKAITVSIGIGNMPKTASHHTELFNLIDQALYRAKGDGRNQTVKAEEIGRQNEKHGS